MKNKTIAIIISIALCFAALGGCGAPADGYDILFANGIKSVYSVVTSTSNYRLAEKFVEDFQSEHGILLGLKYDRSAEGEKEIVFGKTTREPISNTLYQGYDIKTVSGKIYMEGTDSNELAAAGKRFIEVFNSITENDGEKVMIKNNLNITGSTDEMMAELPFYAEGKVFDIGNASKSVCITDVSINDYDSYCALIEGKGYEKYAENTIGENRYATYTSDSNTVNVKYISNPTSRTTLLIAIEKKGALPDKPGNYERVAETQLTQVSLIRESNMDGMSYLYRLADGRFIAIDGGFHEANGKQAAHFYDLITEQNVNGSKPVIALWIITHPHEDHIGMFTDFIARYSMSVEIQKVAMDIGADEYLEKGDAAYLLSDNELGSLPRMRENMEKYIPDTPVLKLHGGQKITIADAEIEILYTLSDMLPDTTAGMELNATSVIFTVTVQNNKTIFLGDAMPPECNSLVYMFGDYLKSDMMQLAHHGYNGATTQIYQVINPAVGLWPSNPVAIPGNSNFEYNKWLIENDSCMELLVSGYYEFTLKLPYTPSNTDIGNKFVNRP